MLPDMDHHLVITVNQQSFAGPEGLPCVCCGHYCMQLSLLDIPGPLAGRPSVNDPVACPVRTEAQVASISVELECWGYAPRVFQEEAPAVPASGE